MSLNLPSSSRQTPPRSASFLQKSLLLGQLGLSFAAIGLLASGTVSPLRTQSPSSPSSKDFASAKGSSDPDSTISRESSTDATTSPERSPFSDTRQSINRLYTTEGLSRSPFNTASSSDFSQPQNREDLVSDSSLSETALAPENSHSSTEAAEDSPESVTAFLRSVDRQLTDRINRYVTLYGVSRASEVFSHRLPSSLQSTLDADYSPVLGRLPQFAASYEYTVEQQQLIRSIRAHDALLIRLAAHSLEIAQFPTVTHQVRQERRQWSAYQILVSEKEAQFSLSIAEIMTHLHNSPIDGARLSGVIQALYGQLVSSNQSEQFGDAMSSVLTILQDPRVQMSSQRSTVMTLWSVLDRLIRVYNRQDSQVPRMLSLNQLRAMQDQLRPVYEAEQSSFARDCIDSLFQAESISDPSTRYERLFANPNLSFLPVRLQQLRDTAESHVYSSYYNRSLRLIDSMIAYYRAEGDARGRLTQLQQVRTELEQLGQG